VEEETMKLSFLIPGVSLMIGGAIIYLTNYKTNKAKARIELLIECAALTIAFGKWLFSLALSGQ
jgi:hydrogenase-4 membrane subunit HyfE